MVGVQGRSGGCATCRRKKKGCDKKTPFCGQCVQAGLVCEGYGCRRLVWINSTDGEKHSYTKTSTLVPPHRSEAPIITLHESLARSAGENRYVGLFLTAFLPNGRLFSRDASQISSAGWLRFHDRLCRSEKTLRFITLAHGLSMLATRDNDSQLKLKGLQAHRVALQEMRVALQDPRRATGDGLLAAVRLFRFYEILYGAESVVDGKRQANPLPQIKGYYAHTDGEMALFMARGYHRKWSEAGRYLLASGRIVSFILSVGRRKRSPFSDIGWIKTPWNDTKKSPLEELTDILVRIPGLLEDIDTIRIHPAAEPCPMTYNDLLDKCSCIEKALIVWKTAMKDDLKVYDYAHCGNTLAIPQVDKDFAVLHLSFFYWSCSILLYTTIHMATIEAHRDQLNIRQPPIPFSSYGYPSYRDERNPTLHADRIIHAIPLSYSPHAGGYAALNSTFPLGIARRYLLVAHLFPHEGGSQGIQKGLLQKALSQPFMESYSARFIDHLHKVETPTQSLRDLTGWRGMESRARRWWFGRVE